MPIFLLACTSPYMSHLMAMHARISFILIDVQIMMPIKLRIREKGARAYLSGTELLKACLCNRSTIIGTLAMLSLAALILFCSPKLPSILDNDPPTCCTKFALPIMVGTMITVSSACLKEKKSARVPFDSARRYCRSMQRRGRSGAPPHETTGSDLALGVDSQDRGIAR